MPDHPLIPVAAGAELYAQASEPAETPAPAPDGDGGIWYPLSAVILGLDGDPWSYETGDNVRSGVAIADGTAVVGSSDNNVYGIDISDGTEQWSYETGDIIRSGVAIADGTAVVGSFDNNVYGIDISDGTEQWSYATGDEVESGVAIADGTAVVGSNDNNVYGLQQQSGQRYETPRISTGTEWVREF